MPLAAALPYIAMLRAGARRGGAVGPGPAAVAAADLAADAVGLAAMLYGSWRYRSLVL